MRTWLPAWSFAIAGRMSEPVHVAQLPFAPMRLETGPRTPATLYYLFEEGLSIWFPLKQRLFVRVTFPYRAFHLRLWTMRNM